MDKKNNLLTQDDLRVKEVIAERVSKRKFLMRGRKTHHQECVNNGLLRGLYYSVHGTNYKRIQSLCICNGCGMIVEIVQKSTSFKTSMSDFNGI